MKHLDSRLAVLEQRRGHVIDGDSGWVAAQVWAPMGGDVGDDRLRQAGRQGVALVRHPFVVGGPAPRRHQYGHFRQGPRQAGLETQELVRSVHAAHDVGVDVLEPGDVHAREDVGRVTGKTTNNSRNRGGRR